MHTHVCAGYIGQRINWKHWNKYRVRGKREKAREEMTNAGRKKDEMVKD
jgi:hypothetical protein